MKNPNSPLNKLKLYVRSRWSAEDYPGAEPRFQVALLAKDLFVFAALPVIAIVIFKSCEGAFSKGNKEKVDKSKLKDSTRMAEMKSQIIEFGTRTSSGANQGFVKRAPGTLVKVKLLNVVETYTTAPVHVRIIDSGLGSQLLGGTLIGDAIPDPNFERININFRFARDRTRDNVAVTIAARALGLDGTLGLMANKKEGFFVRSAIGSAQSAGQGGTKGSSGDIKDVLFQIFASGLSREFGSAAQVENNRAQVLTLRPSTEFFAELTDFFPGGTK